ncbi:hypothetical protein HK101_004378 [Irineochytrium annulatum]|nr:hypothetical protein HK101_004378 [Irineochytrium annulatum]
MAFAYVGKVVSTVTSFYGGINPATLSGALDIVVVQREDGELHCSPFHVRFGKLKLLRPSEKKVYISINGERTPLVMKVGEAGEAFFVVEADDPVPSEYATSPIPQPGSPPDELSGDILELGAPADAPPIEVPVVSLSEDVPPGKEDEVDLKDVVISHSTHSAVPQSSLGQALQSEPGVVTRQRSMSVQPPDDSEVQFKFDGDEGYPVSEPEVEWLKRGFRADIDSEHGLYNPVALPAGPSAGSPSNAWSWTWGALPVKAEEAAGDWEKESAAASALPEGTAMGVAGSIKEPVSSLTTALLRQQLDESLEAGADEVNGSKLADDNDEDPDRMTTLEKVDSFLASLPDRAASPDRPPSIRAVSPPPVVNGSNSGVATPLSSDFDDVTSPLTIPSSMPIEALKINDSPSKQPRSTPATETIVVAERNGSTVTTHEVEVPTEVAEGIADPDAVKETAPADTDDTDAAKETVPAGPPAPLSLQISLCGRGAIQHLLDASRSSNPGTAAAEAEEIFNGQLVTFESFALNPTLLSHPDLIVRINGEYYDWSIAGPIVLASAAFGRPLDEAAISKLLLASSGRPSSPSNSLTAVDAKATDPKRYSSFSQGLRSWWSRGTVSPADPEQGMMPGSPPPYSPNAGAETLLSPSPSPPKEIPEFERRRSTSGASSVGSTALPHTYAKTLRLTSHQLKALNLKKGVNTISFSVTSTLQGTAICTSKIFFWDYDAKVVISDVDGTITKSDVFGHLFTMVGKDWTHSGVASLYTNIRKNGYMILYLTSRAIGQYDYTRDYLMNIKQETYKLPDGPVIMSPDRLFTAFHREVIQRKPEVFKIAALRDIKSLFGPSVSPFYAGFGNRITDALSYRAVDVPPSRIFTIDPTGEVRLELLSSYRSSYLKLNDIVDQIFPDVTKVIGDGYGDFEFWRTPVEEVEVQVVTEDLGTAVVDEVKDGRRKRRVVRRRRRKVSVTASGEGGVEGGVEGGAEKDKRRNSKGERTDDEEETDDVDAETGEDEDIGEEEDEFFDGEFEEYEEEYEEFEDGEEDVDVDEEVKRLKELALRVKEVAEEPF